MNIKSEKEVTNAQALKLAGGALIIAGFLLALLNPLLAIVPVFLAYLLLRRAKKHVVKQGTSVLQDDGRPPVVYLRSFKDEEQESSPLHRFRNAGLKQCWQTPWGTTEFRSKMHSGTFLERSVHI